MSFIVIQHQVESGEADLAVPDVLCGGDLQRVGLCAPPTSYGPAYFWTRYPLERSKFWNLTHLFSPVSWMWTFLTFLLIVVSFKLASFVGTILGLRSGSEEVTLIPFR